MKTNNNKINNDAQQLPPLSSTEERQIMIDILDDVTNFCDTHHITYYLAFGTLIGAIRHKGFIPWDDDIDIAMPRPDFERFAKLYPNNGKYKLMAQGAPQCVYVYHKVFDERTIKVEEGIDYSRFPYLGVDIDIFPLDGQSSNFKQFKRDTNRHNRLFFFFSLSHNKIRFHHHKVIGNILLWICRAIGNGFWGKLYLKSATKYSFEHSSFVGDCSPYPYKNTYCAYYRKELFNDRIQVPFEGKFYWAPVGYDEFLRDCYGDYMQLPPIEKQVTHHRNKTYWKE